MQTNIYNRNPDFTVLGRAKERILRLLKDGEFHTTMEIIDAGGASGLRRLRELRDDGHAIEGEKMRGSNQWRYRLKVAA